MPRLLAAFLCTAAMAGSLSMRAETPSPRHACILQAKITDEDGGAIRAFAFLRTKRPPVTNRTAPVDADGRFKLSLAPGFYDLFVSAPGFQPLAQTIDLHSCQPLDLNLTLFFNPDEHRDSDSH